MNEHPFRPLVVPVETDTERRRRLQAELECIQLTNMVGKTGVEMAALLDRISEIRRSLGR